eukprot:CAMPEP_0168745686 /NCGR_PEP_ID=MMETSP0724-20121128/14750_1 /TAXON_ID=265536 /ORGANISM="Amphiprora sp., Strain CCMP467" /LENGTH=221 /DNA_ID=CAMNT_0008793415 /DNA_START=21 /DNA_END=686 /DNA_ORIENTATION=+
MSAPSLDQLNASAIQLLVTGNTLASLDVFRHSLEVARRNCGTEHGCFNDRYTLEAIHLDSRLNDTVEEASSNDFDMYEGVFAVSKPQHHAQQPRVTDDIEILVLLYNFGFALHKTGLGQQSRSDKTLGKALHLYNMAVECARSIPLDEHPELSTVLLAVSTNQGHIHSHFFQQKEAQKVHDRIESFLAATNPATLPLGDYYFFEGVVLTSGFANTKLPPAA